MADLIAFQERFKAAASDEERKRIKAEMTPDQVAQFDKERAQRRSKKRKISETKSVTIKSEVEDLLISCPLCTKPLVKADREYMATHLNKCSELELIRLMKESDTSKPFPFNQGPSYMNHSAHTEASAAQSGAKKDLEAVDSKCLTPGAKCFKQYHSKHGVDFHVHGQKRHICTIAHLADQPTDVQQKLVPVLQALLQLPDNGSPKDQKCQGLENGRICGEKCSSNIYVTGSCRDLVEKPDLWYFCSVECAIQRLRFTTAGNWRSTVNKMDAEYQKKKSKKNSTSKSTPTAKNTDVID